MRRVLFLFGMALLLVTTPAAARQTPTKLRSPDVIFVATPPEVVDAMLTLAGVTDKDVVYDLGCGDGVIVVAAAKNFGARAVGIDIDPQRVKEATERAEAEKVTDKVKILNGDMFEADIKDATVVTLYLLPSLNRKLMPKLKADLKPGSRVVSQSFDMGDEWPPEKVVQVGETNVYLWTIK